MSTQSYLNGWKCHVSSWIPPHCQQHLGAHFSMEFRNLRAEYFQPPQIWFHIFVSSLLLGKTQFIFQSSRPQIKLSGAISKGIGIALITATDPWLESLSLLGHERHVVDALGVLDVGGGQWRGGGECPATNCPRPKLRTFTFSLSLSPTWPWLLWTRSLQLLFTHSQVFSSKERWFKKLVEYLANLATRVSVL